MQIPLKEGIWNITRYVFSGNQILPIVADKAISVGIYGYM